MSNSALVPSNIRLTLWKGGALAALFLATLAVANCFLPRDRALTADMFGHDFLPFYCAGAMVRTGHYLDLYDLTAIKNAERSVRDAENLTTSFGPWWNPPFAAWIFVPFSLLPFSQALIVWWGVSFAAFVGSVILLTRLLPKSDWRTRFLIPLLIISSGPFWLAAGHAQNTFLTLFLLSLTVSLWRQRRALAAGIVAGLLLYKPQHAMLVWLMLAASLGWRAIAGVALTTTALIAFTLIAMPASLQNYYHQLPQMIQTIQVLNDYSWDRHVTLKAFWRLLLQGTHAGTMHWLTSTLWWTSEIAVTLALLIVAWAAHRDRTKTDHLIAATILATPLLSMFFFDYDLLILAVPAVLCVGIAILDGSDRRLLWGWIIVFLTLYISTQFAVKTRFSPAAPELTVLFFMVVANSLRAKVTTANLAIIHSPPRAIAA
jgi:hypothetical protein